MSYQVSYRRLLKVLKMKSVFLKRTSKTLHHRFPSLHLHAPVFGHVHSSLFEHSLLFCLPVSHLVEHPFHLSPTGTALLIQGPAQVVLGVCMCVRLCMYMCAHMYACACMCACECVHIRVHTHVHVRVPLHVYALCIHMHRCMWVCVRVCVCLGSAGESHVGKTSPCSPVACGGCPSLLWGQLAPPAVGRMLHVDTNARWARAQPWTSHFWCIWTCLFL